MNAVHDGGEERLLRFQKRSDDTTSRLEELKVVYAKKREAYIASGLLPDPSRPGALEDATKLVGTCEEMCPEYERLEREVQKELDRLEVYPGTNKANPAAAVKIYRRPAAGRQLPLPEEIRPAHVLRKTLDYLFGTLLPQDPHDPRFAAVQPFLWNRTRAVRQDFIVQSDTGLVAIECHERIARYHIFCLHWKGGVNAEAWSEQQELEQLSKTLRSLIEYYDDQRILGNVCQNEPEFRAYNLLLHARDPEALREIELLPTPVFSANMTQLAVELRTLIQRSNLLEKRGNPVNTVAAPNYFTKFFSIVRSNRVPYLLACLAEHLFTSVRIGAIKTLSRAYMTQHMGLPVNFLSNALAMDSDVDCIDFLTQLGVDISDPSDPTKSIARVNKSTILQEDKTFPVPFTHWVEEKREDCSCQQIIDNVKAKTASTDGKEQPSAISATSFSKPKESLSKLPAAKSFQFIEPVPTRPTIAPASQKTSAFSTNGKSETSKEPNIQAPRKSSETSTPVIPSLSGPAKEKSRQSPEVGSGSSSHVSSVQTLAVHPDLILNAPKAKSKASKPRPIDHNLISNGLVTRLADEIAGAFVYETASVAIQNEHRRRQRVRRAKLLDEMASFLFDRLQSEPVQTCVLRTSQKEIASAHLRRHSLQHTMARWCQALADKRDQACQTARLQEIRKRLPGLRLTEQPKRSSSSQIRAHVHALDDDDRIRSYHKALRQRERLWRRGTFASILHTRISQLAFEHVPPQGAFWTMSLCLPAEEGVASEWLKEKFALHDGDREWHIQGAVVSLLSSYDAEAGLFVFACTPSGEMDAARLQNLQAKPPEIDACYFSSQLLIIAWTRAQVHSMLKVLDRSVWQDIRVLLLDDATRDVDGAFEQVILQLLPCIHWRQDSMLDTNVDIIKPLYNIWYKHMLAIVKLLQETSELHFVAYCFQILTSFTNVLLRQIATMTNDSSTQPYLLPEADVYSSDYTLYTAIMHQLKALRASPELSLLQAEITTQGPTVQLEYYLTQIVSSAMEYFKSADCTSARRPSKSDITQLDSLGDQIMADLAKRAAASLPSKPSSTSTKRNLSGPSPISRPEKRLARDSDLTSDRTASIARLRQLMASTQKLLHSPSN
ncbi:actin cytoskeleton and mitosis protein [Malassezia yamatoensis]|uniref:Actin cytoskeleton and mitosis protein n=1 Tax=Malassezia yamatoensis TaxID=253288 RepID=A0AAJ6CGC6_9BASI|nr:actin cytoskeleton and mitosis protein [Malassezia yamatoensis]